LNTPSYQAQLRAVPREDAGVVFGQVNHEFLSHLVHGVEVAEQLTLEWRQIIATA
jgi:hypothetical protein